MKLKIKKIINGPFEQNAYIAFYNKNDNCIIIDPGLDLNTFLIELDVINKRPIAILLTHAHLDHIGITYELQKKYSIPVYLHSLDEELSNSLPEYCNYFNIDAYKSPIITDYVDNCNFFQVNKYNIKVFHTPGHTEGGVSYLINNNLFVGDTIFKNSIGRTDLPGGNHNKLISSIKNKIFILDGNINIFSGHGEKTSIQYEKKK